MNARHPVRSEDLALRTGGLRPGRLRILAFAYDLEPDKGSEPGAGWGFVRILAGFADVTVITRSAPPDETHSFATWQARIPEPGRVDFVYVPLSGDPDWAGIEADGPWWSAHAYIGYIVWQMRAARAAKRLHEEAPFDLTWHVTWANGWLGSTLASIDAPFILGPIGGGVSSPLRLALGLGRRGVPYEVARWLVRTANRWLNPLALRSWRRARLILVQNPETLAWLPQAAQHRARLFHNATVVDWPPRTVAPRGNRPPTALFAGRLIPWKGWRLAVQAIAGLPDWRLIVCGDGPSLVALEQLVGQLGLTSRVEVRGWQQRDEILRTMAEEADVLLFPSLHDEAGMVIAEAVSIGLPIVCLDVGGPPFIAGHGVRTGSERGTIGRLRDALRASVESDPTPVRLDPLTRRAELLEILQTAGLLEPTSASPTTPDRASTESDDRVT